VERYHASMEKQATNAQADKMQGSLAARLGTATELMVSQQKEWGEILTGFEAKNKYVILERGEQIFHAAEIGEGGMSTITRLFLKSARPFTINIHAAQGGQISLRVTRPWRWYFHRAEIFDAQGEAIGSIEKVFDWLRRVYVVKDEREQEICKLFGPILKPWTFLVMERDREVGKIAKNWSGLGKEMFTKADNFGVSFPAHFSVKQKCILLGAVFLIDFVHFEQNGNG
jgi:rRNA processing protein Gar1